MKILKDEGMDQSKIIMVEKTVCHKIEFITETWLFIPDVTYYNNMRKNWMTGRNKVNKLLVCRMSEIKN